QPVCLSGEPRGCKRRSPALWRRSAGGWGREKGRAGCEPGLFRPFSLTGIDAVPPHESSDRLQTTRGRGGAGAWCISVRSCGSACEQFVLLRPVQRQIEFGQPRRSERDGLPALQDRLDQLRAQEGEANETATVAPGNAVTLGQLLERSGAAGGKLLKPCAPPRNRLAEGRITSRAAVLLRQSGQYQPGFDTAVLEGDRRRQF